MGFMIWTFNSNVLRFTNDPSSTSESRTTLTHRSERAIYSRWRMKVNLKAFELWEAKRSPINSWSKSSDKRSSRFRQDSRRARRNGEGFKYSSHVENRIISSGLGLQRSRELKKTSEWWREMGDGDDDVDRSWLVM
jgi:hypothetical protein